MTEELQTLRDITTRPEAAGQDHMLTGSVALNCYAQPRMTRDIDLVVAFFLKDAERIERILGRTTASRRRLPATPCYTRAALTPFISAA